MGNGQRNGDLSRFKLSCIFLMIGRHAYDLERRLLARSSYPAWWSSMAKGMPGEGSPTVNCGQLLVMHPGVIEFQSGTELLQRQTTNPLLCWLSST